jgi:hypothetical protein
MMRQPEGHCMPQSAESKEIGRSPSLVSLPAVSAMENAHSGSPADKVNFAFLIQRFTFTVHSYRHSRKTL